MEEPFSVQTEENAFLLARYLTEDNNEPFIELDLKKANKLANIQSVFKHVVGKYLILSHSEETKLKEEVAIKITKYKNSIMQAFSDNKECREKRQISYTFLEKMLNNLTIGLKPKHLEYITLQLFKLSNNLQFLDYKRVFSIFELESLEERSPSPSPLRKTQTNLPNSTNNPEETRSKKPTIFKFRSSTVDAHSGEEKRKNMIYFGEGFFNEIFKSYYLKTLNFSEIEEIKGLFYYENESFEITGEFQSALNTIKFAVSNKKITFDGVVSNKNTTVKGTLKMNNLEEDLAFNLVTKIWKYDAKYTNNKSNYEFNGFLCFKGSNLIEGKGVDLLGEYSIKGTMDRELHLKFIKSYRGENSRISFEGVVERDTVTGHYEFEEEEGEWSMKFQEIE